MVVFIVTLRSKPGDDGIGTLRAALKVLGRRFGLKAIGVEEEKPRLRRVGARRKRSQVRP
jgi:hypothetical protein